MPTQDVPGLVGSHQISNAGALGGSAVSQTELGELQARLVYSNIRLTKDSVRAPESLAARGSCCNLGWHAKASLSGPCKAS